MEAAWLARLRGARRQGGLRRETEEMEEERRGAVRRGDAGEETLITHTSCAAAGSGHWERERKRESEMGRERMRESDKGKPAQMKEDRDSFMLGSQL